MLKSVHHYLQSQADIGYMPRQKANPEVYREMGFKSGLEIHQQLKTEHKLFCRCPAGRFQKKDDYNAELIRHMRPTLSELGEYDGTALMEFKTRKNIHYLVKNESACTYDFDDTPPFMINNEALDIALHLSLLLKQSIVGELHITRKQYLDGSIPTGFQRTAIVGINGQFDIDGKTIHLIQTSIEEDSCREVSDIGHDRYYTTDRLGMPLIEIVTQPEMLTPDEIGQAAQRLRFITRSTEQVNTGMGAGRQDVNVSIRGGTRVEIKGVAHAQWIPELVHNEAFRQKALLAIKAALGERVGSADNWQPVVSDISEEITTPQLAERVSAGERVMAVVLPGFEGLLSHFTSPGRCFAHEIADRLKVVACLEKPNMATSEDMELYLDQADYNRLDTRFDNQPWVIFWGPQADMATAAETVEERCRLAFEGVPNETRKSRSDGTTFFERVLPGPDRMYPDTDAAPIPIAEDRIEALREGLPNDVSERIEQMTQWGIPRDSFEYLLSRGYRYPLLKQLVETTSIPAKTIGTLLGHTLKFIEGQVWPETLEPERLVELFGHIDKNIMDAAILKPLMSAAMTHKEKGPAELLESIEYQPVAREAILARIPHIRQAFKPYGKRANEETPVDYIMGKLRPLAMGNMDMRTLREAVEGAGS